VASSVTFAIPFYSGVSYLARALRSIVAQTDDRWEAVVCDDGNEPSVDGIVRSFGNGRVRYQKNERNLGIAGNFNRCIEVAKTELSVVLHQDDELMPSYTGTMLAAAERHPKAAAFFCPAQIIDENGDERFSLTDAVKEVLIHPAPGQEIVLAGEQGVRTLLKGNFIMAPTLCFRKSVLGDRRFPTGFKFVMDLELTTRLFLDGESMVGVPDRCYRYRRHEENATSKYTRTQLRFREESEYYDRMKIVCAERGWDDCVRLAAQKRMIKLNITYRALKNIALLDLGEARRGFRLLRDL
jgi:GT2 family glycosyltransferase